MKLHNIYVKTCNIFLIGQYLFFVVRSISAATSIPPKISQILQKADINRITEVLNETRRILYGHQSRNTRPYMVYLKLPTNNPKFANYRRWLCGGVIVHEEYIITSAACIEDVKNFYVVSGTYKHSEADDRHSNACIKNGAKKAVWKCIPRNYVFDGHENDNIRWMNNDIAIVRVEEEFDFTRRIRGCDFTPKPICYNNQSSRYEDPGTIANIAGWGSTDKYDDWVNRRRHSADQELLETEVELISKRRCKARWGPRYHNIIENYMICSKDTIPELSAACSDKYVECTDIMYSNEDEEARRVISPNKLVPPLAHHNETRRQRPGSGGFCENDHGGPLIYSGGPTAIVIGIISACLVKERTNKCYGPFLYTSVYKNRMLINCAIYKDIGNDCSKLFRSSESYREEDLSWVEHPDGPAKSEVSKGRRTEEKQNVTSARALIKSTPFDTIVKHGGVILRSSDNTPYVELENANKTK